MKLYAVVQYDPGQVGPLMGVFSTRDAAEEMVRAYAAKYPNRYRDPEIYDDYELDKWSEEDL